MSKPIIEVQHLSKQYKLGAIGTGTISHDLNRWWNRRKGNDDALPANMAGNGSADAAGNYIWSLKDVSFSVNEGEIFGVIGKNGAGKSTLLKLLSKITKPTSGTIRLNGRIASLLEVGTGFHPDLTGRENVFLNGAILGMRKAEIVRKFDEIVGFAGVEKFIDTPVKRYSSGMYVRLAFAVAAHLEPEILIIDEVLAVGDAEFQQKCMGKIRDVSFNNGRTVLFVSHNITAIKQLCNRVTLLENGLQKFTGAVDQAVKLYQEKNGDENPGTRGNAPVDLPGYFLSWKIEARNNTGGHSCQSRDHCHFIFSFRVTQFSHNCEFRFVLTNDVMVILNASSLDNKGASFSIAPGNYHFHFRTQLPISHGTYNIEIAFISQGAIVDLWNSSTPLTVLDNYETHVHGSLLNLPTEFSMEEVSIVESSFSKTAVAR
jgi:lipopolysaccharide transport system ATP-binding protein